MVGAAVFNRPLDAAGAHRLAVADLFDARGVEHFQVFERVAVDDDEVGREACADAAQAFLLAEDARVLPVACWMTLSGWKPASWCSSNSRMRPKPYIW